MTNIKEFAEMKGLVKRYLDGLSSSSEDKSIEQFLKADKKNLGLFRLWEKEWEHEYQSDDNTQKEWDWTNNVLGAYIVNMEEQENRKAHLQVVWHHLMQAAAIVAFIFVSSFATWYIMEHQSPKYYACNVPYGSKTQITLPDGSKVWLNAGSRLTYSNQFDNRNRKVQLQGEGYFEVAKHQGAEFTVSTKGYDVIVKGTHFDVSAYNDDPNIVTSLLEGSVEIARQGQTMMLKPGENASLNISSGSLVKSNIKNEPNAWIDRRISYDAISTGDLARILSREYAVNIHILNPELNQRKFAISLRNKETISEVISTLQSIASFKVERNGKDIYIR